MIHQNQHVQPFKSARQIAIIYTILTVIYIVLALVGFGIAITGATLIDRALDGHPYSKAAGRQLDAVEHVIAIGENIAFAIGGIAFLVWLKRARDNLNSFGVEQLQYKEVDAIGGFVVPLLNLYRPPKVIAETWRASDPGQLDVRDWRKGSLSATVAWWWIFWLAGAIAGDTALYFITIIRQGTPVHLTDCFTYYLASGLSRVFVVISSVLILIIVFKITFRQEFKHIRLVSQPDLNVAQSSSTTQYQQIDDQSKTPSWLLPTLSFAVPAGCMLAISLHNPATSIIGIFSQPGKILLSNCLLIFGPGIIGLITALCFRKRTRWHAALWFGVTLTCSILWVFAIATFY